MIFRALSIVCSVVALPMMVQAETGKVSTFSLDNGLKGIVIEDHRAPIVTNMVWYNVGAADEPPGMSGVAHFLEHLMFKGTKTLKPGEFSKIVKDNGGVDNAFTSFDYTGYFQRVAVDRLPLMMQLEADRMRNLVLTENEVLTERNVVLEERNSRTESDPGSLFQEQRRAVMFMNHPYRTPVIGWRHEIEQLNLDDAIAFYKTYYAPNNATLVVAGDVTPEQVKTLAEEYFGALKPSENIPPRIRPQEPPHLSPIRMTFSDPRQSQPYIVRSYLAPKRVSGDQSEAAALTMLSYLLGGSGISSVLGQKLQLDQKLAVYTDAWYDSMSYDPETFGMYAMPRPGVTLEQLETAMDKVLADFLKEGIDTEHLARLKTQIAAEDIYELDDQSGVARTYGQAITAGLTVADVQSWSQTLQAVTPDDIMAAAAKVLNLKNSVTGLMLAPTEERSE
ncbi:pitrilysin family protein [Roseobacter sp. N2S]|uniref:M16 family metallopeptidase n=1 Tax=Roseobacter sp. N2S TaxID=2663844 RepID=UPI00286397D9|nr:pitrilysin family protein [Roseobacter sp. N2S]MDR6266148.1 zinc protease [Roseobacter sp. N2S]